jgi:CubicO group peptidase (beta-lactamase class C family)
VTKVVTAAAVLKQVDAGRVALDTPVHEILEGQDWPPGLTVGHLLSMTSGLSTELRATSSTSTAATQARLRHIAGLPTAFAPGERYRYDNNDYIVLGGVLERLTVESYNAVAARTLGRAGSSADDAGCSGPDLATPYAAGGTDPVRARPLPVRGRLLSRRTVRDRLGAARLGKVPQERRTSHGVGFHLSDASITDKSPDGRCCVAHLAQ